ncbi:MAG: hypothetical protein ACKV19_12345 [Verrucomicrobiales bacterium]
MSTSSLIVASLIGATTISLAGEVGTVTAADAKSPPAPSAANDDAGFGFVMAALDF